MPEETRTARRGIVTFPVPAVLPDISLGPSSLVFTGWAWTWGDRPRFQGSRGPGGGHAVDDPGGRRAVVVVPKPGGRPSHSAPPKKIPKRKEAGDDRRITAANYRRISAIQGSTEPLRIINAQISDKVGQNAHW